MRKLSSNPNVILSDSNYPNGRIRNNTGTGNGTPVNESVYGDIHVNKDKLMDLYGITPNELPDNEANGYQIIEAMRALAGKNDIVTPLTLDTGVLSVPIKLGFMLENEQIICKAGFDLSSQTQIKGSDNVTLTITTNGSFKTNEYVRLIKTASGVTLVRLVDNVSLDDMVNALLYLKKASQSEEDAGTIDTKATTPKVNKVTFAKRVNGSDSATYLATALQNGLLSKEDYTQIQQVYKYKNFGTISSIDVATSVGARTVSGDIVSAIASDLLPDGTKLTVTMANAMDDTNYLVKIYVQGVSSNIGLDNNVCTPVFKPLTTTTFEIGLAQAFAENQNLKLHIEVKQL
jgi:hypothetical protein